MSADAPRAAPPARRPRPLPRAKRPDDCDCGTLDMVETPCWPCYQAGFRSVARWSE